MESGKRNRNNLQGDTQISDGITGEKIKFPLYLFRETMELVNTLYAHDNCKSKTEFIEKAVRFYCGYLLTKEHAAAEFIAPHLTAITEGSIRGSEQRLSRAMFKIAVELGAVTHMLAAISDIDEQTLYKLRAMCTEEVQRINGIINFEKAVRYQKSE